MNILFQISDVLRGEKINIDGSFNLETLLGQIILNKITGIAYDNLNVTQANKEFYKTLSFVYNRNIETTRLFKKHLAYLAKILNQANLKYALLKGAFLSTHLYKEGHRTSNDIDVLVNSDDISKIQGLLEDNGFIQGKYDENAKDVVAASRKEIIQSRMNFGETIPFIKIMDGNPLEIDINFSVDFKPSSQSIIVPEMLDASNEVYFGDAIFKTLNSYDFLIQLCCHLYKEATTYDWVKLRKDLMLYKFSDINVFLHKFGDKQYFTELTKRIRYLNAEKECFYTFENSSIIYPNLNIIDGFVQFKNAIMPSNIDFMKRIIHPREKKLYTYDMTFTDWFFCEDRIGKLQEIPYETI